MEDIYIDTLIIFLTIIFAMYIIKQLGIFLLRQKLFHLREEIIEILYKNKGDDYTREAKIVYDDINFSIRILGKTGIIGCWYLLSRGDDNPSSNNQKSRVKLQELKGIQNELMFLFGINIIFSDLLAFIIATIPLLFYALMYSISTRNDLQETGIAFVRKIECSTPKIA